MVTIFPRINCVAITDFQWRLHRPRILLGGVHLCAVRVQAALPRPLLHVARQPREREHEQDVRLRGRGQGLNIDI